MSLPTNMSLHDLSKNEVANLSKEELLALFNVNSLDEKEITRHEEDIKTALKPFNEGEADLELLQAISDHSLYFMKYTNPLHQKISRKVKYLKEKAKFLAVEKMSTDTNPDAFISIYSELKYETHKPTAKKWQTDILKVKGGQISDIVAPPVVSVSKSSPKDEEGLVKAPFKRVKQLSPRQKNDIVTIMGLGFGRGKKFCHNTASVAHELLQDGENCVLYLDYVPEVEEGNTPMMYRVTAAIFTPVQMMRHETNKITAVRAIKAVNLVQIATLPEWGRRNLGGMALEYVLKERLQDYYDLVVFCGCARKFYLKMNVPYNPSWLAKAPFNFKADPNDPNDPNDKDLLTLSHEQYNRHLFFYIVLNETLYKNKMEKPLNKRGKPLAERSKPKFSFEFSEYLQGYYGFSGTNEADENEDDENQTDENVNPN